VLVGPIFRRLELTARAANRQVKVGRRVVLPPGVPAYRWSRSPVIKD
jgi:hypothetical protein